MLKVEHGRPAAIVSTRSVHPDGRADNHKTIGATVKMHERLRVIRSSRVAPSERHLLTVIACYLGDDDNGPAFPSVGTMAKETGYAESQVHNLLRSMLASGLITREDGGRRALFTRIRWETILTHVAAPSGRGGARAKAPKTAPMDDAAPLDDGSKDWTHEGAKTGGEGAKTGAMGAKTAPDQIMIRPEIRPEDQTSGVRAMTPNPALLTALLFAVRSDPMPTDHPDSRPKTDTAAADNDEAMTPNPEASGPLPPWEDADWTTMIGTTEAKPGEIVIITGRPKAAPLTDPEQPATSETSAPDKPDSGSLLTSSGASPTETKRERAARLKAEAKAAAKAKASEADAAAWATCAQHWQTISGKLSPMTPDAGMGLSLMEAIERDGAAVVVRRFAYLASGPGSWIGERGVKITAVCRSARSEFVVKTDREALDWERDRTASEALGASGGMLTHPSAQNASERQAAPKQTVSWADVLRDLGSDPQTHPEDGPHRVAWQSVRQAVLVSTRKAGDPWLLWCRADDRTRQHVESLLSRGLVR